MVLIDNLDEVRWSCPYRMESDGAKYSLHSFNRKTADSCAYTLLNTPQSVDYYRIDLPWDFSFKNCGTSAESNRRLLTAQSGN